MRLICIDNGPVRNHLDEVNSAPELKEGEFYTVFQENKHGYQLLEVETPEGFRCGFAKVRFIPTSDIDEVQEVEKLWRFLESDFYETYLNKKK